MPNNVAVVVGNPKPRSRTLDAAANVAKLLFPSEEPVIVDIAELGSGLLQHGDTSVAAAIERACSANYTIFASPTYKATYTGLLKIFLDQIPHDGLRNVTAIPLMVGGTPRHALAADLHLKPILEELGASCPARGLFLLETEGASGDVLDKWLERSRKRLFENRRGLS